jgi:hypothetical protein
MGGRARELQRFYLDLSDGRRPKLALMAPPQHGKSTAVLDFIAWIAGKHPDLKIIFASYSDELGTTGNRFLFRTITTNYAFGKIVPNLRVGAAGWAANNNVVEFVAHQGSFRNTTVDGAMVSTLAWSTIRLKVRPKQIPSSTAIRLGAWFTDDFFNRFAKDAGLLIIMTRWHVDDVLGRTVASD